MIADPKSDAQSPLAIGSVRFNICNVIWNQDDPVYYGVLRCLHGSLNDLGYECSIRKNILRTGAVNIVVGNLVAPSIAAPAQLEFLRGSPFILYQLEQLPVLRTEPTITRGYFELLEAAHYILEFSPSGFDLLHSTALGSKTFFLPPSYHRSLEFSRPTHKQDIDVLFYGSYSDRRSRILEELRSKGIHVVHLFGVYEEQLTDYICRSKIILNIHVRPNFNHLETVRIAPLLANGCFVISETSDHNPYGDGVVFSDIDQMTETCMSYLGTNADKRETVARQGYLTFRRSDMMSDLGRIIEGLPLPVLVYHPSGWKADQPFVSIDSVGAAAPLFLLAHVGYVGDIRSDAGLILGIEDYQNIQGFVIDHPSGCSGDIYYRAKLANGSWTDFVGLGEFVGTRGKSEDLTGFSVRLGDRWREIFDLDVIGSFRGLPDKVIVRDGEDCVTDLPSACLFGIQLILRHKRAQP